MLSRHVPLAPESCAASTKSSFAGGNLNHVNVYGPPSCIANEASRMAYDVPASAVNSPSQPVPFDISAGTTVVRVSRVEPV